MVRVPGSSGDSGFHHESQEEVKVKIEQGDQASSDLGSTTTPLNEARPTDRQSAGRSSIDGKEADPDPDLEDKPQSPPQVPAKWTSLKDPDLEEEFKERPVPAGIKTETSTPTWNEAGLEFRYHRKELQDFMTHNPIMRILQPTQIGGQAGPVTAPATANDKLEAIKILMNLLQEAGLVAGAFDAEDLFRPDLQIFQLSTKTLFDKLKVLPKQTRTHHQNRVGCAGAAMLHAGSKAPRRTPARSKAKKTSGAVSKPAAPPNLTIAADNATASTDKLESYFQAAMSRFLREQQISVPNLAARALPNPGTRDVEMESAGSEELERLQWEYDPDDLDLPTAASAAVATAAVGSSESTLIQRVRISAISDLKECTGKDQDED
ncbi:hypothetical protein PR003_g12897 [Phytophthora rubi]|uniref:Uncharacterized protein n=1 Tax=Phytophthora rubi TaxID=129364 RepID=A0A6A4F7Z0_9STRA|nr:hypothetical protein PR003_g12897 [Phytophthora rubi]